MPHFEDRPIMRWSDLCAVGPAARYSHQALLNCGEFLKAVRAISGHLLSRRALQFYSSPDIRLMSLPRYARRHTAHYLHPENTMRLAVIAHLRAKYFFPIKLLREVLATLPSDHYGLVLRDGLTSDEIQLLARPEGDEIAPRDLIFRRVSRLLSIAESGGKPAAHGGKDLAGAVTRFQSWWEANAETSPVPEVTEMAGLN